ncbi:MAG TPA: hypothetical protein VIU12_06285 [Chryseolinea sp.]
MTIEYIPNTGFKMNSVLFTWTNTRDAIRANLNHKYKADDKVIELAKYWDGDESKNIKQRRDIYENYGGDNNYFFLNYSEDDKLESLEFHWGATIMIEGVELNFDQDIDECVSRLDKIDKEKVALEEGSYLFKNLKITIANSESMGGDGNDLGYFYASRDISHLLE